MQEKRVRQEIYRLLKNVGYWPVRGRDTIVCSKCSNRMHPPIGRPDILVLAPKGTNCVIEVKVVNIEKDKAFAFNKIRPEQRAWMNAWHEAGGDGYLAVGTVNVRPRRLWLISWARWMPLESALMEMGKKSIPVDLETYSRLTKVTSQGHLREDIAGHLRLHELEWIEGQWWLHENHALRRNIDVT